MLSDQFLIDAEHGAGDGKRYRATYSDEVVFFTARNKQEAVRIAREWGFRFKNAQRVLSLEVA
jgi:hypothetical protein